MGLVSERRRRNVFRVAIAYVLIAWIILEAGDVLAPALHLPEWVVSALVFFLVLGFPLALIFAWAFELTPDGIKLEKHVDRSTSITHLTGRKLDYVIIGVLAAAIEQIEKDLSNAIRYALDESQRLSLTVPEFYGAKWTNQGAASRRLQGRGLCAKWFLSLSG